MRQRFGRRTKWWKTKTLPGGRTASRGRTFTDESIEITYRGHELGRTVEVYATAFPDMHRKLYRFYESGNTVVVEGTHTGPLALPAGTVPPTGKRMDAPCCDVFRLENGKIQSFNCYPSGTIILAQLGVFPAQTRD
jgi:ketosteroid isomerase-like protein